MSFYKAACLVLLLDCISFGMVNVSGQTLPCCVLWGYASCQLSPGQTFKLSRDAPLDQHKAIEESRGQPGTWPRMRCGINPV